MVMELQKHGAENIYLNLKKHLIFMAIMLIKHGSLIILAYNLPKEPPCFQEFQNRLKMDGATNI